MIFVPFPADYDPYGKDLSPVTSGKDNVYRVIKNREGLVARLELLSEEETDLARGRKPKKVKK